LRNTRFYQQAVILACTGLALTGTRPAEAAEQDARIESTALASFAFRTDLRNDPIRVVARNGVVTLTGMVAYGYHRFLAGATLADLPGVTRVDNHLLLLDELATDRTPPAPEA
jgi:osmotically-inducible protein OsmY